MPPNMAVNAFREAGWKVKERGAYEIDGDGESRWRDDDDRDEPVGDY